MTAVEITPWQLFLKGGPVMWPLLLCWIISLAIFIERVLALSVMEKKTGLLSRRIFEALDRKDVKDAVQSCEEKDVPLSGILKAGLLNISRGREDMLRAMEEAARLEIPGIERGFSTLGMMSIVAPILGVLGTVVGLAGVLRVFEVRLEALNALPPADMVSGIWAALITTAAGLLIALSALLAQHYLVHRASGLVDDMEHCAKKLLSAFDAGADPGDDV